MDIQVTAVMAVMLVLTKLRVLAAAVVVVLAELAAILGFVMGTQVLGVELAFSGRVPAVLPVLVLMDHAVGAVVLVVVRGLASAFVLQKLLVCTAAAALFGGPVLSLQMDTRAVAVLYALFGPGVSGHSHQHAPGINNA